jgi:hypothetical protein
VCGIPALGYERCGLRFGECHGRAGVADPSVKAQLGGMATIWPYIKARGRAWGRPWESDTCELE